MTDGPIRLDVERLCFGWPGRVVAENCDLHVDFRANAGRLPITGMTGIGKSTLLYVLAGLKTGLAGRVAWTLPGHSPIVWDRKRNIAPDAPTRLRLRTGSFGFAFQDGMLLPYLSVLENLAYALDVSQAALPPAERLSDAARRDRLHETLGRVLLASHETVAELGSQYPRSLSGGQRRRVSLAQAMIADPMVLFADEPSSGLDDGTRQQVMRVLHGWVDAAPGTRALVWVTHHEDAIELGPANARVHFHVGAPKAPAQVIYPWPPEAGAATQPRSAAA